VTAAAKDAYERIPYMIVFQEKAAYKDTYAGELGIVALKAHLLKPARPSKTVLVFMHPIGGGEYLPMPVALAKAGHHVIYCNSRYPGVDHALQMEKVVLDLGACIRDAKERLGYERVVLAGWSGGGSLSAFYQAEAESPSIKFTPAGEPFDLAQARLIPADALMLLAAHVSRAVTLTENLDASLLDEADPERRERELDLYDPQSPNRPPYSAAFVTRYRAAQIARNHRITAWVRDKLEHLRGSGRPHEEFGFVVHGTLADPRWLDPAIDPNDRVPGTCFLGEPRLVNNGPVGLARFCTLRSWLSQWSVEASNADGVRSLARIAAPVLVLGNSADNICTPSHTQRLFEAVRHADKERAEIKGATHYYIGQKAQLEQAAGVIDNWLQRHALGAG
jgi:alpha-beta hydrolase superfamily lysophospholipase